MKLRSIKGYDKREIIRSLLQLNANGEWIEVIALLLVKILNFDGVLSQSISTVYLIV